MACIGYFTRKPEGIPHKNILLHIVCPALGILVFLAALYGQFFTFDSFFGWGLSAFPLNWIGWSAIIWLALGVVVTFYMRSAKPEALDRATHAFGGESERSLELDPLDPFCNLVMGRAASRRELSETSVIRRYDCGPTMPFRFRTGESFGSAKKEIKAVAA